MKHYYQILGISETSNLEEVKKTYKQLVKKYHPDKIGNTEAANELATEKLQEINEAYSKIIENIKNFTPHKQTFKFLTKTYNINEFSEDFITYMHIQSTIFESKRKIKNSNNIDKEKFTQILQEHITLLSNACVNNELDISEPMIISLISEEKLEEYKKISEECLVEERLTYFIYQYTVALLIELDLLPENVGQNPIKSASIMELMTKYENSKKIDKLIEAFECDYLNTKVYKFILTNFGDPNNELDALETLFKVEISEIKQDFFEEELQKYRKYKDIESCRANLLNLGINENKINRELNKISDELELKSLEIPELNLKFNSLEEALEIHKKYKNQILELKEILTRGKSLEKINEIESLINTTEKNDTPIELKKGVISGLNYHKRQLKENREFENNSGNRKKIKKGKERKTLFTIGLPLFYVYIIYSMFSVRGLFLFFFKYILVIPIGAVLVGLYVNSLSPKLFSTDSDLDELNFKKKCLNCGENLDLSVDCCKQCGISIE